MSVLLSSLLPVIGLLGCGQTFNQWEGSVDAVFKYRASESSTVVHETRPDSFAGEAGLKTGDMLLSIDNMSLTGATFHEVRDALRGPVGTNVVLTVRRGDTVLDIPIERRPVSKK